MMNNKIKTLLIVVGLVALIGVAYFAYTRLAPSYQPNSQEPSGEKIESPDFTVTDPNGNSVKLSDFEGEPVVLNFWASWCPPCLAEMYDFNELYQEKGQEVSFLMVNMTDGQRETKEKAITYIDREGFAFPVYFDLDQNAAIAMEVSSIPTTYFIDRDGFIVSGYRGGIDKAMLQEGIDLINSESP